MPAPSPQGGRRRRLRGGRARCRPIPVRVLSKMFPGSTTSGDSHTLDIANDFPQLRSVTTGSPCGLGDPHPRLRVIKPVRPPSHQGRVRVTRANRSSGMEPWLVARMVHPVAVGNDSLKSTAGLPSPPPPVGTSPGRQSTWAEPVAPGANLVGLLA